MTTTIDEASMTARELEALRLHNSIFTKPAIRLIQVGDYAWRVHYADGSDKWSYECGDRNASRQITRVMLGRPRYDV